MDSILAHAFQSISDALFIHTNRCQLISYVFSGQQFLNRAFHVQTCSIVAGIGFIGHGVHLALDHELVVVQVTVIGGNAVLIAHVLAAQAFFTGHEGLV